MGSKQVAEFFYLIFIEYKRKNEPCKSQSRITTRFTNIFQKK